MTQKCELWEMSVLQLSDSGHGEERVNSLIPQCACPCKLPQFGVCPVGLSKFHVALGKFGLCQSTPHIHLERRRGRSLLVSTLKMYPKMPTLVLIAHLVQGLIYFVIAQQAAPWRNRIQWVNNGQVFSLLSTGSEYQAPVPSRRQSRVYVSNSRDAVGDGTVSTDSLQYIVANSRVPGARQVPVRHRTRAPPGTNRTDNTGAGVTGRILAQGVHDTRTSASVHLLSAETSPNEMSLSRAPVPNPTDQERTSDEMAGDDHRNTIFHNIYPPRVVAPRRPPPGTGYGTRYFQNGESCVSVLKM